jgi:hypothetical protein
MKLNKIDVNGFCREESSICCTAIALELTLKWLSFLLDSEFSKLYLQTIIKDNYWIKVNDFVINFEYKWKI